LSGGTTYSSDGTGNVAGGYHYELWHDGGGSMKMTVYGQGAAFKADWNNAGDFLARVGLKWDSTKTYDQYGTITADYSFTKTGSGGGYSFIGIYGWTKSPLIEYYIVEDWFGNGPPTGGGSLEGSFDVDGGTYKIYKFQRVNKPSIEGTSTFWQFFSVRQKARQCGHISITEHFKKWASLNLTLGKMYEAKILVEAGGGQGTFDLHSASMSAK
jgi:Glycosyl hydrolases family 11